MDVTLLQAQELIEKAMSSHRRESRQVRHLPGDETFFDTAAGDLITAARREVLCVLSVRTMSTDRRSRMIPLLQEAHQRGVDVRALVPSQIASTEVAVELTRGGQFGYRTRELPDQSLLIVDGQHAALGTPQRPGEPAHALLVSVVSLVQVLRSMFGFTWSYGVPLTELLSMNDKLNEEPARSVLANLGAGTKDEVAARRLGISVRTYRRHVAEIMRGFEANSRFQAGVRAARLGVA
ncbi:hypothetical protein O7634_29390 [Micromonospora sp. WMMD1120]|uniref:hypothetical protein n=1 Tax=Micromonospora sp. WMMD1120 TaxID=3016106 RepID=UPI002417D47E|nr:hypothetical protein [Micromonospora sp. WMMD1120]MDG4810892.1 hypothetical protein [Micromonospora sp. WMMD1120]